ncbi:MULTISPECIES: EpsD family peptidyl-prolyl cis-trans isomerase [unclassified Duganella]|uniref:EpsD family peptidyl-prolyl cis-trans isomerase n=1 Tax=unclassified Duganella TaxID=2636909 RepID=UPI000E357170|nr:MULTISPECIES: EpsD family peptidyl-prolyl cis-trans isomerase [unclassified Duganella]RFP09610.1 peptidyl-prolyl cis-trans isomerase, EpsD family [Duganella sp. BJB475]RFP27730.1 peptidyl-prolyl cis-trans isomerase, EpsD family [Duganella sp. BJB476]
MANKKRVSGKGVLCSGLIVVTALALGACGNKEKKPGQSLVSVNGEEITVLQLNEELQRAGVQPAQQEAARKQLLESLIDRQLLQSEAAKDKTDRDPKVVQSIERAKALIVAQAYIQKRVGNVAKPTVAEAEAYYKDHPLLFSQRKQLDMRQLVIASKDMDATLKSAIDNVKTLDDAAAWMDAHQVRYARTQLQRSTTDLPTELATKLLAMPKGQLFIITEGERSLLNAIGDVKEAPVSLEVATPQIQQFLYNKKTKEAADAEIARLRAAAKIEYLNKADADAAAKAKPAAAAAPAASAPAASAPAPAAAADAVNERGAAGLK